MQPIIWNDERITAYVLGELSAEEATRLESEMQSNVDLAQAVDEAKRITSQLSSMFASEPPMSLDSFRRDKILATPVTLNARTEPLEPTVYGFRAVRVLSLAATVLLVGTLGTIAYRSQHLNSDASPKLAMGPAASLQQEFSVSASTESEEPSFQKLDIPESVVAEMRPAVVPMAKAPEMMNAIEKVTQEEPEARYRFQSLPLEMSEDKEQAPMVLLSEPAKIAPTEEALNRNAISLQKAPSQAVPASPASPESMRFEDESMPFEPNFYEMAMSGSVSPGGSESLSAIQNPIGTDRKLAAGTARFVAPLHIEPVELQRQSMMGMEGSGPGNAGDRFEPIVENGFRHVSEEPLSTFSVDVDTASYSKVRQFLMQANALPPAGAVRIEELVNYFDYQYEPPAENSEHPFVSRVEVADCPWTPGHRLARVAIKGKVIDNEKRPSSNLVFLVDTSGSMSEPNKLPLVKEGLRKLIERLGEKDRIAIVVYAGSAGLVLDSTPATERSTILRKLNQMQSGGSTNGGEGIRLAYQVARDHFIDGGVNRVILCSDGDFNVGTTSTDELVRLVETEAKGGIDITVLGFGMGNHNDSMMEQISGRGNGNYAFIDTASEANRVLVEQSSSTLVTIARDVKIQIEFNPAEVAAYRLIGYENRALANEDFKDDTKDAGEIGAGHSVTALYELIPADGDTAALPPAIDELRYQKPVSPTVASSDNELMNVKLRYKDPGSDKSTAVEFPVVDQELGFDRATGDFRFAASVAGFGMLLRSSEHIGKWTLSDVEAIASQAKGSDPFGYRAEFIELVRQAAKLRNQER